MAKKKAATGAASIAIVNETKINKSAAIRAYLESNPNDKPKAAAEALSKQLGIEIKPSDVSQVKVLEKKKAGLATPKAAPGSVKASAANVGNHLQQQAAINSAKDLLKFAGSPGTAKLILEVVCEVQGG